MDIFFSLLLHNFNFQGNVVEIVDLGQLHIEYEKVDHSLQMRAKTGWDTRRIMPLQ
jgi:hypothetical protein